MKLKEFDKYLSRPFENFEYQQIGEFSRIIEAFKSSEDKEYEISAIGFLNPSDETFINRTKQIIEEKEPGYTVCLLMDIPLRKTKQVVRCLS